MALSLLYVGVWPSGPEGSRSGDNAAKCDLELMNSFKLVGMPVATQDTLAVCAAIQNNCCTIVDEVAIVKFWREFSASHRDVRRLHGRAIQQCVPVSAVR